MLIFLVLIRWRVMRVRGASSERGVMQEVKNLAESETGVGAFGGVGR